jgi:hypothetical protein
MMMIEKGFIIIEIVDLGFDQVSQTSHCASYGGSGSGTKDPSTSCNYLFASSTFPNTDTLSLHRVL